jgi:hypothetical protein
VHVGRRDLDPAHQIGDLVGGDVGLAAVDRLALPVAPKENSFLAAALILLQSPRHCSLENITRIEECANRSTEIRMRNAAARIALIRY